MPPLPPLPPETRRAGIAAALALLGALLAAEVAAVVVPAAGGGATHARHQVRPARPSASPPVAATTPAASITPVSAPASPPTLPGGRVHVFDDHTFVVAYYGTAGTPVLGVLGRQPPDVIDNRLTAVSHDFARPGQPVQKVYELIVTVADWTGPDFNHDIARAAVRRYIAAAHRHGALLVLDIQPGRADFLRVVKRWAWALRDPWVGLALDPEWRMRPGQVPGRVLGSVGADEINRVSAWLSGLVAADRLPEKLFLLHEFKTSMIRHIGRVLPRPGLAMVQHVDGFGTPGEKLDTFHTVARPRRFTLGFKLFYKVDVGLMAPRQVLRVRPRVRFVSYQ